MASASRLFTSAARASLRRAAPRGASRIGQRNMSAPSHASKQSSDKAWIIGATLIFGPAFLYLVSPSARKNTHHVHNDAHDFPGHKTHENPPAMSPPLSLAPPPTAQTKAPMADDEGTVVDVASSLHQSEVDDVPKADQAGSNVEETLAPQEAAEPVPAQEEVNPETPKTDHPAATGSGTFQSGDEQGPTDLSPAREAAKEGQTPKEQSQEA